MKALLPALAILLSLFAPVSARADARPLDALLTTYDYPYPVSHYAFKAQGQDLDMAYMDVKPEGTPNGKTVVLLHGKNFGANYWKRTIKDLTAGGYRVIAPDQIGFGKSSKPEYLQFSFAALADWTNQLLDQAGVKTYDLVGHSMGGMLATRIALMYPDRVEKLALVNPIGLEDWKTMIPYASVDDWYERELKATPDTFRNYQKNVYFDGQWKPEYEELIEIPSGWTKGQDWPLIAWNSALLYDMIVNQPVVYEFKNLKMPTLLIIGTRDRTAIGRDAVKDETVKANMGRYDRLGKTIAQQIPNAKLVEFDNVGHMPQIEVYDKYIAALTGFLR
jgi:pimeloyl-ACP methyl ester carboxylesterase